MTTPPPTLTEEAGEWRRDLSWSLRCRCGHDRALHRPDLKTSSPCGVGGCGCRFLRAEYVTWRETRTIYGLIGETS